MQTAADMLKLTNLSPNSMLKLDELKFRNQEFLRQLSVIQVRKETGP